MRIWGILHNPVNRQMNNCLFDTYDKNVQLQHIDVNCNVKSDNCNINQFAGNSGKLVKKTKKPKKPDQYLDQSFVIEEHKVILVLPLKVCNEGNCNENWRTKHARHKKQQTTIQVLCRYYVQFVKLPCKIHMVRYAPRMLDVADNLPYSFKWINDAVCDLLIPGLKAGRADGDPRIFLSCGQEKSKLYGLKIIFEF